MALLALPNMMFAVPYDTEASDADDESEFGDVYESAQELSQATQKAATPVSQTPPGDNHEAPSVELPHVDDVLAPKEDTIGCELSEPLLFALDDDEASKEGNHDGPVMMLPSSVDHSSIDDDSDDDPVQAPPSPQIVSGYALYDLLTATQASPCPEIDVFADQPQPPLTPLRRKRQRRRSSSSSSASWSRKSPVVTQYIDKVWQKRKGEPARILRLDREASRCRSIWASADASALPPDQLELVAKAISTGVATMDLDPGLRGTRIDDELAVVVGNATSSNFTANLRRSFANDDVKRRHFDIVCEVDWAGNPLGPMDAWPAELRAVVASALHNPTPKALYWGRDLRVMYNAAYAELCGPSKHPRILGQRYCDAFSEIWPLISQIMDGCFAGQSTLFPNTRMLVFRQDRAQEAYFNGSFSPIYDDAGQRVLGVSNPCVETTSAFVAQRRLEALHDLFLVTSEASDSNFWPSVHASLRRDAIRADLPFLVFYAAGSRLSRTCESGSTSEDSAGSSRAWTRALEPMFRELQSGTTRLRKAVTELDRVTPAPQGSAFPSQVRLEDGSARPIDALLAPIMRRALAGEAAITLDAKDCRTLFGDLRHPDWTDDFIERALVFSVGSDAGMFSESAVAIVALNTRRDLDPAYLDFLNVVGSEIRAGLATLSTNDDRVFATQFRAWRAAQRHAEHVEKTRAEDAIKERDRTNRFIDLLSHELRNPLGAIVSGVELIGDRLRSIDVTDVEGLRRERDDCLDECATIDYSLAHVQRLLDETLLLSKSENGFLTLSTEAFRPRQLVRDILRIFEVDMRKKDIEATVSFGDGIVGHDAEWLKSDPGRISQILINLLGNSIKFTAPCPRRQIEVFVDVLSVEPDLDPVEGVRSGPTSPTRSDYTPTLARPRDDVLYMLCEVRDTGPGLGEAEQKRVFGRFQQARITGVSAQGSTGLGLHFALKIAELLGGTCGVRSTVGEGSTFSFYVACSRDDLRTSSVSAGDGPGMTSPSSLEAQGSVLESALSGSGVRLLVVEDNSINQTMLKKQLVRAGYTVETADDGQYALDMLLDETREPYALCLMDMEMPRVNGIQATAQIRQLEALGRLSGQLPILGVSANVRDGQVEEMLASGMTEVLPKPCKLARMLATIQTILSAKSPNVV